MDDTAGIDLLAVVEFAHVSWHVVELLPWPLRSGCTEDLIASGCGRFFTAGQIPANVDAVAAIVGGVGGPNVGRRRQAERQSVELTERRQ